jgi:hypothetical protein
MINPVHTVSSPITNEESEIKEPKIPRSPPRIQNPAIRPILK